MKTKICSRCKEEKDLKSFYHKKRYKDGIHCWCISCIREYQKGYNSLNHEKQLKQKNVYYHENKEKINKQKKIYRDQNKDLEKSRKLKKQYNLTLEQYNDKLEAQNNQCAICGLSKEEQKISFCVDHDHETEKVRGLLCSNCNRAIGLLKDDSDILLKAYEYLKKYKETEEK